MAKQKWFAWSLGINMLRAMYLAPAVVRPMVTVGGMLAAVALGLQFGWGSIIEMVVICAALAYGLLAAVFRCRWESLFIGLLVFGYLVGNRGFAQFMPIGLPLLPGEAGVLIVAVALVVRVPLERDFPFRLTALTVLIGFWIATSAVHMLFDLPSSGFLAIRDFAMVYYALFYFAGVSLADHRNSILVIEWALGIGYFLMSLGWMLSSLWPTIFDWLTWKGIPLIFYKGDLVGMFAATGVLFYYGLIERSRDRIERIGLTILMGVSAGTLALSMSRAAMLGLAFAILVLLIAGRWQILVRLAVVGLVGSCLVIASDMLQGRDLNESPLYGMFEHSVSLIDFSGTYQYQNPDSIDTGDNNRFRIVWWESLFDHVMEKAPIQGLGFGYDLANPFIQEYYPLGNETFQTRSPHNFLLSVFGRTGFIGVIFWALILIVWISQTWSKTRNAWLEKHAGRALIYNLMAWAIFIGAIFQVVLEGPMGAVLFWLFLGLSQTTRLANTQTPKPAEESTA
ncbi:MAG: O-antigen ligase family protein [Verrucomicrobiota bacterium]